MEGLWCKGLLSSVLLEVEEGTMSVFEEKDLAESEAPEKKSSDLKNFAEGIGGIFVIGLAIWLGSFGWGFFKRIGWIEQTRIVDVHMSGDWLTGEYRSCQTDGRADVLYCPNSDGSQSALAPSGQMPRSFSVGFHGNITGKPVDVLNWKCKREIDSISCHALQ